MERKSKDGRGPTISSRHQVEVNGQIVLSHGFPNQESVYVEGPRGFVGVFWFVWHFFLLFGCFFFLLYFGRILLIVKARLLLRLLPSPLTGRLFYFADAVMMQFC